jgi:hypothetical protein
MTFLEQQMQAVREWVAGGASLSDVQRNLKSGFDITLTYMDVRLLVLEIGAELKDKPEPKPPEECSGEPVARQAAHSAAATEGDEPEGGSVSLTLDALMAPGAMVSGHAVFSDRAKARWVIDQYGRFGMEPEIQGYRPTQEDMQTFQVLLRTELQRKGYM